MAVEDIHAHSIFCAFCDNAASMIQLVIEDDRTSNCGLHRHETIGNKCCAATLEGAVQVELHC